MGKDLFIEPLALAGRFLISRYASRNITFFAGNY
mgnify:FL=1|jgi:hypothetical protein